MIATTMMNITVTTPTMMQTMGKFNCGGERLGQSRADRLTPLSHMQALLGPDRAAGQAVTVAGPERVTGRVGPAHSHLPGLLLSLLRACTDRHTQVTIYMHMYLYIQ